MKRTAWITASLAVVVVIAGLIWWWQAPEWPDFAHAPPDQPQAVVQVDRDYAYHIGDLISFDVFLKQQADVSLDASTLAVRGDFELVGKPKVVATSVEEGITRQHVRIKVQSFASKPELKLEASFAYKKGDQRLDLPIPPQSFFTSKTWDGRKQLKEGDDPRVPFYWYAMRSVVPLSLGSLAFLVLCVVAIRATVMSRPKPTVDLTREQVAQLLQSVRAGTSNSEDHKLLDGAMRARFNVGPIPVSQIDHRLQDGHLVDFLRYNAKAVYSNEPITLTERELIAQIGELLLRSW